MKEKLLESINKKLEVMIALLLQLQGESLRKPSLRKQIEILKDLKVESGDIANILGRSRIFIHKELFRLRSKKLKK